MAQPQFVAKAQLFEQITAIVQNRESGFLTILTDTNRSVLLRFSLGKLTRLHCRSKEAGDAIQVLVECRQVKYTYVAAPRDDRPELMPTSSFLQLIDLGAGTGPATGVYVSGNSVAIDDPIRLQMLEIATEYIGIVAEMIVDEAFAADSDIGRVIDYVGESIPDPGQAAAFLEAAREHFSIFQP